MFLLLLFVLIPLFGGVLAFLLPRTYARSVAIIFSSLAFALGLLTLPLFRLGHEGFQFLYQKSWVSSLGISFKFGADGLSYPLILLTLFLGLIATLIPFPHMVDGNLDKKERAYWGMLLLLTGSIVGVFASLDLFVFYVFWEIVLVLMFFLIMLWGGENRRYAAMKFFIYTQAASLIMLIAIIALAL